MPLTHLGYSVQVEVEGEELPQFQVERSDERTMTCWMPSEAGKAFLVRTTTIDEHEHEHKAVKLFADGRSLQGYGSEDEHSQVIQYRVSPTTREPFIFSAVAFELADEDNDIHAASVMSDDIGVIEVQIWATVRKKKKSARALLVQKPHIADAGIKLSEKSKLIGANHVKPGIAEPYVSTPGTVTFHRIGTRPYAVFRFKHRPKELLQALGVMPRPARAPTPPAPATSRTARSPSTQEPNKKRPRADDDVDADVKPRLGMEDAEARRRRIEGTMAALQAELADLDSQEPSNVKAERAPSPIAVPRHGEVIDLTLDD